MFSMQYRVLFGRDFDPRKIEARIAVRAAPYDDLEGLAFKAFMLQTADGEGANAYSSYYVWRDTAAFESFLLDREMFGALSESFGRPNVALETVLDWQQSDPQLHATYAVQSSLELPDGRSHRDAAEFLRARHAPLAPGESVLTLRGDPWRVTLFSLLPVEPDAAQRAALSPEARWFRPVHISRPAAS